MRTLVDAEAKLENRISEAEGLKEEVKVLMWEKVAVAHWGEGLRQRVARSHFSVSSRHEYWSGWPFPSPGIFQTQRWNPGLLDCRQILHCLSHQGSLLAVS